MKTFVIAGAIIGYIFMTLFVLSLCKAAAEGDKDDVIF